MVENWEDASRDLENCAPKKKIGKIEAVKNKELL